MRRRHFIALLGIAAAWPLGVPAQQTTTRRVGALLNGTALDPVHKWYWEPFADDLRKRGWEEGRNIIFEKHFVGSDPARFPELAAELIALKVDVIVTANTQAAAAAQNKTMGSLEEYVNLRVLGSV